MHNQGDLMSTLEQIHDIHVGLAESGVEKWTVDTKAKTLTYTDKQRREVDGRRRKRQPMKD